MPGECHVSASADNAYSMLRPSVPPWLIACRNPSRWPMPDDTLTPPTGPAVPALAVDAKRIVAEVFPDLSLRTWRRLDSSGRCPRGLSLGGRKLWRVTDLERWAAMGFPSRDEFEKRSEPA